MVSTNDARPGMALDLPEGLFSSHQARERFQREARTKRRLLKSVMRSFPALKLAVLDERVVNRQWRGFLGTTVRRRIEYLPDPGPQAGGDRDRPAPAGRRLRVLLIGRQSRRKGLPEFVRALETGAEPSLAAGLVGLVVGVQAGDRALAALEGVVTVTQLGSRLHVLVRPEMKTPEPTTMAVYPAPTTAA